MNKITKFYISLFSTENEAMGFAIMLVAMSISIVIADIVRSI